MAITKSWTDAWLDGKSDTGDKIDNKVNEMSSAIHERMKNGGHRWEDGTESQSGIHYVSVDNYRPDEWNVFKSDRTGQVITCKDDEFRVHEAAHCESTLHVDGNVNFSNDLDVGGTITQDSHGVLDETDKRLIVLHDSATGYGAAIDYRPRTAQLRMCIPKGVSGRIKEVAIYQDLTTATNLYVWKIPWNGAPTSVTKVLNSGSISSHSTVFDSSLINTSISGGETIRFSREESNLDTDLPGDQWWFFTVTIEVDW